MFTYNLGQEEQLRSDLITPLLEKAAKCSSSMILEESYLNDPSNIEYASSFTLEVKLKQEGAEWGAVDYTFCGWLDDNLYQIPIEAKCQAIPTNNCVII